MVTLTPPRQWTWLVNGSSGGGRGLRLLADLRREVQGEVQELRGCDLPGAVDRAAQRDSALVVVGGDGSVVSVLERIAAAGPARSAPPVAVVPLGTGNDLARVLWGWDLQGLDTVDGILDRLARTVPRRLDRWRVTGPGVDLGWYNYCSWGADAHIVRLFDQLRRRHPAWFRSVAGNRLCYALQGLVQRPGRRVAGGPGFGRGAATLLCAGIPSYAGGCRLDQVVDIADGRCELFALPAPRQALPRLQLGRRPTCLGRRVSWRVALEHPVPMQIDGEPHLARAGSWEVRAAGQVVVLGAAC